MFQVALVGAGRMGRMHLRALRDHPDVRVCGVVEASSAARQALLGEGLLVVGTIDELLEQVRPDGVIVATPTVTHVDVVRDLLERRLPVLCEKPCGVDARETSELATRADALGVPLQVAYWRRYVPGLQQVRELVRSGEAGDIHHLVSAQWDESPPPESFRSGSGGIFVDMGVHEFDEVRWLTGQEFTDVYAVSSETTPIVDRDVDPDTAQVVARLSGGATCLVSLGRHHPAGDLVALEVYGTARTIRLVVLDPADGDAPQIDALRRQAAGFADYVAGGDPSGASPQDAIAAQVVAQRAGTALRGRPAGPPASTS
jgi:myo-inositol 2-dehydrogenase/D-chiro-inositol 1-dehydrogenase